MTTKYITWSGGPSGDYTCDGTNDHVEINQALAWANANPNNTIYIKGPHTYDIGGEVLIGSSTEWTGDSTAVLRLKNSMGWTTKSSGQPMIGQIGGNGSYIHDVTIHGFEVDGNEMNQSGGGGVDLYRLISFQGASNRYLENIRIYNMKLHDAKGEGFRCSFANNVYYYNNNGYNLQHTCIMIKCVNTAEIHDNTHRQLSCAADRIDNCLNVTIYNETITPWDGASNYGNKDRFGYYASDAGIQIGDNTKYDYEKASLCKNIVVKNCNIKSGVNGILLEFLSASCNINVYNNTIHDSGYKSEDTTRNGAIGLWSCASAATGGITIQNNTITGWDKAGIQVYTASGSGNTLTVKNNNFENGKTGPAILNNATSGMSVYLNHNYLNANPSNYSPTSMSDSNPATSANGLYNDGSGTGGSGGSGGGGSGSEGGNTSGGQGGSNIPTPYIPISTSLPTPWIFNYYIPGHSSYVNGVAFNHRGLSYNVSQSVSDEHPPGTDEDNIGDFGEQSATYSIDCFEWGDTALQKAWAAVAAWKGRSPAIVELGGPYTGWYLEGIPSAREGDVGFEVDSNWFKEIHYVVNLLCPRAVFYSTSQRIRARKVYEDQQIWNSDDCYAGNLVKNGAFDNWTAQNSMNWSTKSSAANEDWRDVAYSPQLNMHCAVAKSGSSDRIMISTDGGNTWRTPTGLASLTNRDNNWRSVRWISPNAYVTTGRWVILAESGTSGYYCATSEDGDNWTARATPANNSWVDQVYIQPNDTLANGRIVACAYSGTNRIMYSDNCGESWTVRASAIETNNWLSLAYSETLTRLVCVSYSGSNTQGVQTSDDYGLNWTARDTPAYQKWTCVRRAEFLGLYVAVSEDGTQQCMTSEDGTTDWTLQTTPYDTATPSGGGTVVSTNTYNSPTGNGYSSAATAYSTSSASLEFVITLPALTNGHVYTINRVAANLFSSIGSATAYLKVTAQSTSLGEVTIKEWTTQSTTAVPESFDCAVTSATNEQVKINFYMKTSNASYRAKANSFSATVSEMTTSGASITYTRNQWRGLAVSPEYNLLVAVSQTGTGTRAMFTSDAVSWTNGDTTGKDNNWTAICWAAQISTFAAVGSSGTGNRVMTTLLHSPYDNIAPDGWTLASTGQTRYSNTDFPGYVYEIVGDGVTADIGCITQPLGVNVGSEYILSATGFTSGLTQGNLVVEIWADGTTIKQLTWDENNTEWTSKQIAVRFETTPLNVMVKVHGIGTPNSGSYLYVDYVIFENYADFDISSNGSAIITGGYLDAIPDVKIESNYMATSATSTGQQVVWFTSIDDKYSSAATAYKSDATSLELAITLPALSSGNQYRLDEVFSNLAPDTAGTTAYMKVTVQSSGTSLFSGVETQVAQWSDKTHVPPNYASFKQDLNLLAGAGETITIRYYMKTSSASVRANADHIGYKYSVVTTTVVSGGVSIINTADPLTVMPLCNTLLPGCSIRINADMTGAFEYSEDYRDNTWAQIVNTVTGTITYSQTSKSITINPNSYLTYMFDTLCPVTGIPFINMQVISGNPIFSISVNGTDFFPIDGNTVSTYTNVQISRQLDNRVQLNLKGYSTIYVRVASQEGTTCTIGPSLLHCDLNTMDIPRIKLFANGLPQSIQAFLTAPANAVITIYERDTMPVV